MKFYISDLSILLLAVIYLPLVVFIMLRVWRGKGRVPWRLGKVLLVAAIATVIALGDVTVNSLAMAKVCPQAGTHVYKVVPVEGYLGLGSGDVRSGKYRFMESPGNPYMERGKFAHFEMGPDGKVEQTLRDKPEADYEVIHEMAILGRSPRVFIRNNEVVTESTVPLVETRVREIERQWVRNRYTGDVLGEKLIFQPLHGWVDRYMLNRWFGVALHGCGGYEHGKKYESLEDAVLPPKPTN